MKRLLIHHACLVTVEPDGIIPDGTIVIEGDHIVALGPAQEILATPDDEVMDARGMIALPGLVNAHFHPFCSVYRGALDDLGLGDMFLGMALLFFHMTPEETFAIARLAALEMLKSGTTYVNCFGHPAGMEATLAEVRALSAVGLKGRYAYFLQDRLNFLNKSREAQVGEARTFAEDTRHDEKQIDPALGLEIDVLASPALLRDVARLAAERDLRVHVHMLEFAQTRAVARALDGREVLDTFGRAGLLHEGLMAAHCRTLAPTEARRFAAAGVSVRHCPTVYLKYAEGKHLWLPIRELLDAGANVALGSDTSGLTGSADLFQEMKAATLAANFVYGAPGLRVGEALRMATINGARAVGMANRIGSLEVDKAADIVLLRTGRPHLTPLKNVVGQLVNAATAADVDTVLIDGRIVLRGGRAVGVDETKVIAHAEAAASAVFDRAQWHVGLGKPPFPRARAIAETRMMGKGIGFAAEVGGKLLRRRLGLLRQAG
ncbi:MAG: amidohydrolase family protein [Ardenticatenaceae bacterium]|nr:amidohydrolase family protein [Ardenticatenaceae bacterium]